MPTQEIAGYRGDYLRAPASDNLKMAMYSQIVKGDLLGEKPEAIRDIFINEHSEHPEQVLYAYPYDIFGDRMPDQIVAVLVSEKERPFKFRRLVISDCHKVPFDCPLLIGEELISVENAIHIQCNQPTV